MMSLIRLITLTSCILWLSACQSTGGHRLSPDKIEKSAQVHYQLGINALYAGDLPKAFDELMRSNQILPKQTKTLDALAYAWRLRGDYGKAEALYKESLTVQRTASSETNYGSLLIALKRYDEAEVHLRLALQDPRYRKQYITMINLGDALLGQGEFTEAIKAYRKAGLLNPAQNISKLHEAAAYIHEKRWNYAQALYESMLQKMPTNKPALEGLIQVVTTLHQASVARQYLAAYIEKEKDPLNRAWANDELVRLGRMP